MMNTLEENWVRFFQTGVYSTGWTWRVDDEKTRNEVDAVLGFLKPEPGAHILDWCGGWGRHSVELAKRGFRMTLLDFAENHIRMARRASKAAGVTIKLIHRDFRYTPYYIQADYAINMFTAGIGYLTEEDDIAALCSLHTALKPGAKILVDTMNLFWLIKNYSSNGWHENVEGKVRIFEERKFDLMTNRNHSKGILWQKGKPDKIFELDHRIYSACELARIFVEADFEPIAAYGNFDGQELTIDSPRIIMIGESK